MLKFYDVPQNTDEWMALRLGKATASQFGTFMANYGKEFGDPAKRYALVLWNHGSGVDDSNLYAANGDYFSGDAPPVVRKGLVMNTAGGVAGDQATTQARKCKPVPMAQARAAVRHGRRALFGTTVQSMVKTRAIAYDDQARDFLDNMELKAVLGQMKKALGRPLDIIGFDACLMSMLEVDHQLRGSALCAIGSEEEEPGNGWPYDTVLSALAGKPQMTGAELAIKVVGLYAASYGAGERVTLAACDLAKSAAVVGAVDALGRALLAALPGSGAAMALTALRARVQEYTPPYDEYVDLVDLCEGLQKLLPDPSVQAACAAVKAAAGSMVLASAFKGAGVARSHGLSIYFPKRRVSPLYAKLDFSKNNAWAQFIGAYVAQVARPL